MKITDVPWRDLRVGQRISVTSPTDVMGGVIVLLEREPMVWIAWNDGNRYEYTQTILSNVDILEGEQTPPEFDPIQLLLDREVVDTEGE